MAHSALQDMVGRVCVITGAASLRSIGYATAELFAEHGAKVVVVDVVTTRRADLHADLLAALGADGGEPALGSLSAISYRSVGGEADGQLLAGAKGLEDILGYRRLTPIEPGKMR